LLLILLFCRQIVGHAIRPLNRLLDQSQLIASGNYEERIPHSERQDAVGRLQNCFVAMQDSLEQHVNEIQQKIAETEQRNQELARANEMAKEADLQKTAFIQNMSHQIRTPLNIIMGVAQVIRDSSDSMSAEEMKGITDMMSHSAMTLSRLVLMLYDSSDSGLTEELSSHRDEEVSCNDVARECIENTRQHFPDIPIIFETSLPDSFTIHTNGLYLMRSLREILYNSAKYSDGQHIAMFVSETDDYVRFVFEDTGQGIADNYREQMFIPFSKVDDLSQGLGLGLPLSKRHVDNLGGKLMLDPDYKEGCRIIIEIPKK
jgi:signal transduction histidine kinase